MRLFHRLRCLHLLLVTVVHNGGRAVEIFHRRRIWRRQFELVLLSERQTCQVLALLFLEHNLNGVPTRRMHCDWRVLSLMQHRDTLLFERPLHR